MWARVVEFMLAGWLAASPFIFQHPDDAVVLWASDFACASAVGTLALISYWQPTRHAHLLIVPIAIWMMAFGRFAEPAPVSPGLQNNIVAGLLLLMFAIVPNRVETPPRIWFREPAEQ